MATSFFKIAAQEARGGQKINVGQRAQEIASAVADFLGTPEGFSRIEAVKGYLNLYFSTSEYSRRVVDAILTQRGQFGRGARKNARVMVEYSQPNTHKAFHVGHLRSAILGDVICRILDTAGYEVIRANYFGDIGLHVIKWLWNYMKYHPGEHPPAEDVTRWMGELYAEASRRLDENPTLEAEVREVYARWDRDDHEIVALWKKTRQWSLDGFDDMYRVLDIPFDRLYANSDAEKAGKEVVQELIGKNLAVDERPAGPVIVKIDELLGLEKEKYRVFVVLRSDGTALYSTEDL
ncbi:MAG TPA: arginine--tRNA ligase, partial [Anaerolineales bacterium]|nr:arginine--tRNA ligase [Anaerolineales bacterium]